MRYAIRSHQPKRINIADRIPIDIRIQIDAAEFPDRVAAEPAAMDGTVGAVVGEVKPRIGVAEHAGMAAIAHGSGGSICFRNRSITSLLLVRTVRIDSPSTTFHSATNEPAPSENNPRN